MKAALLVGMLAGTVSLCGQTPNSSSLENPSPGVPAGQLATSAVQAKPGAVLAAELTRGLDAKKVRPGDPVFARCTQDFNANGEIFIPRNAKLIGHVVEVQAKGREKPESMLAIGFEKVITRDGREIPLNASIQALAPPAILAAGAGSQDFDDRNAESKKARTAGLFPGAIKTVYPENSSTATALATNTNGVVGLKGLQLESAPSFSSANVSVIHSNSRNVRLESGTRLILRVSIP